MVIFLLADAPRIRTARTPGDFTGLLEANQEDRASNQRY